ncbi:MAG: hypothetical protein ACP5N2_04100 [Candidatus Nanoarchaeia archaeon]
MVKKTDVRKVSAVKVEKMNECLGCNSCSKSHSSCGTGGAFYGLGFIGAVIYYISIATSFWVGVLGVLKAIVWPVFLIFGLLKFIGA